jgi:hypothetical protein
MIYIKSILVGVVALFATTIVYVVILIFALMRRYSPPLVQRFHWICGQSLTTNRRSGSSHSWHSHSVSIGSFAGQQGNRQKCVLRARTAPHSRLLPARNAEPTELSNRFKFFSGSKRDSAKSLLHSPVVACAVAGVAILSC